jgi:hypothetical protein
MTNHLLVQIEELKSRLTSSDPGLSHPPLDNPPNENQSGRLAEKKAQLADLEKLKVELGSRGFWRKARQDPTVQVLKDSSLRIYNLRGLGY